LRRAFHHAQKPSSDPVPPRALTPARPIPRTSCHGRPSSLSTQQDPVLPGGSDMTSRPSPNPRSDRTFTHASDHSPPDHWERHACAQRHPVRHAARQRTSTSPRSIPDCSRSTKAPRRSRAPRDAPEPDSQ